MKQKTLQTLISFKFLILWVIIPLFLLFFWIIASILFNPHESFTTFLYFHSFHQYTHMPKNNLLMQGESLIGEFRVKEHNLGIIAIQVSNTLSVQPDKAHKIQFTLKEKNAQVPYYQHTYTIDAIKENNFLVFGFPKITSALGKTYQFEVLSLDGDKTNAVFFLKKDNAFITRYIYSFKELYHKKLYLFSLLYEKVIELFSSTHMLLVSSLYLLPLFFYLYFLLVFTVSNTIAHEIAPLPFSNIFLFLLSKKVIAPFLLIIADVVFLNDIFYGITLGILGILIIFIVRSKLPYTYSLLFSIIFLLLAEFCGIIYLLPQENKLAMWGYYTLVIAVFQILLHFIFAKRQKMV